MGLAAKTIGKQIKINPKIAQKSHQNGKLQLANLYRSRTRPFHLEFILQFRNKKNQFWNRTNQKSFRNKILPEEHGACKTRHSSLPAFCFMVRRD